MEERERRGVGMWRITELSRFDHDGDNCYLIKIPFDTSRNLGFFRKAENARKTSGTCDQPLERPFWLHPAYDTSSFFSPFFFPLFHYFPFFLFFLLSFLFTCNTSVRNRVALNESVGVYRSWQYFKSAPFRQMQRVGQVRPGIHLNSLLRHISTMPRPLDCHRHLLHRLVKDAHVSSKQTFLPCAPPSPTGRENNNSPCK